jgi:hypothetical protein
MAHTETKILPDDRPIWGASAAARSASTAPASIICCRATCYPRGASEGAGSRPEVSYGVL